MDEHNLQSVAFPSLDETQIGQLARCTDAAPKWFRDGQVLFAVGQRNMNFFVVKSGEVEIVDRSGDEPKTVTIHRPGEFTGDISHLTGLPAVVSGVARGDCRSRTWCTTWWSSAPVRRASRPLFMAHPKA